MPASELYTYSCCHGGPPPEDVLHLMPTINAFLTEVWANEEELLHEEALAELLRDREFKPLLSRNVARVLISEAVDCHARSEDIARNFYRAAILVQAAVQCPCKFSRRLVTILDARRVGGIRRSSGLRLVVCDALRLRRSARE